MSKCRQVLFCANVLKTNIFGFTNLLNTKKAMFLQKIKTLPFSFIRLKKHFRKTIYLKINKNCQ